MTRAEVDAADAAARAVKPPHVIVHVPCTHCQGAITLACDGLSGFFGYETYNEFACPHCRKKNFGLTPGGIASVSAAR